MNKQKKFDADVVVIGAGITGASIARELSKYNVATILVEKGGELCAGATKVTLGNIYSGINYVGSMILKSVMLPPGTPLTQLYHPEYNITKWNEQGFDEWDTVLDDLDIKHKFLPQLILAKDEEQIKEMNMTADLGKELGGKFADFKELERDEIFDLEPHVNKDVMAGLYAPDHVIEIFPPEVVIGVAENAVQNGVQVLVNAEVTGITQNGDYQIVETAQGNIETRYVVNAAGGWADRVADMAGGRDWNLTYNKSQLIILHNRNRALLKSLVRWPMMPGKVQMVLPRDDDYILISVGGYDPTDGGPADSGTMGDKIFSSMDIARTLVPSLSNEDIISTFAGVRVFNTRDVENHILEFSPVNPRFFNAVVRLPGIIGALPLARHVVSMLADGGLQLVSKSDFQPKRKAIPRVKDLSNTERDQLIAKDAKYGRIICRCEQVTEGEIVEAIRRGAVTLDGIKFRTRAMMGRCQSNFCGPKVANILARELGVSLNEVMQKGTNSKYLSS